MIKQNKGEWSELYVFLKLLGDGVIYAADSELNKIGDLYYPLVKIIRKENKKLTEYIKEKTEPCITVLNDKGEKLLRLEMIEFESKAKLLLNAIKSSKKTFSVPEIEKFMALINCCKVKADSNDKSDITVVLHDVKTYCDTNFGFSIKSNLGQSPTLYNSGKPTNITYEIEGDLSQEQISEINSIKSNAKIRDRIKYLYNHNCKLIYNAIEHDVCKSNLQMIDTHFPEIIAEYVLYYYSGKGKYLKDLTNLINALNPCRFNLSTGQCFYEHKIKTFLTNSALGMTAAKVWSGNFQATGGYIVVKEDGEILCYHIYNHNEFRDYIFNNTYLDTPSTTKYDFGYVYNEHGKNFIKLNLQVRFV